MLPFRFLFLDKEKSADNILGAAETFTSPTPPLLSSLPLQLPYRQQGPPQQVEICNDDQDNDGDGQVDWSDSDCKVVINEVYYDEPGAGMDLMFSLNFLDQQIRFLMG